jgi:hypothetical protein
VQYLIASCIRAYEITHVHKKEPPPKEILEDVTARGAALLTRTLENFKPPGNREQGQLANGEDSDHSGDEGQGTPNRDKGGSEEPGSIGRITRGDFNIFIGSKMEYYGSVFGLVDDGRILAYLSASF